MLAIAEVSQNILDLVKTNDSFFLPEGQARLIGPLAIENGGEYILEDNAHLIIL